MTKKFHFKAVLCMIGTLYPYTFQADLGNEEFLYRIHRTLFPEFQMLLLHIDCIMVFLCNTWLTNILYKVITLSHSYWFLLFWNLVLCEVNIPSCGKIVALNLIVNECLMSEYFVFLFDGRHHIKYLTLNIVHPKKKKTRKQERII